MNKAFIGVAAGMASIVPAIGVGSEVEAKEARVCVDANWGQIGPEDQINVVGLQQAVGTRADGIFGPKTCDAVWRELIKKGNITGSGTKLRIGKTVHNWLGVAYPSSSPVETSGDKCSFNAINAVETARLIGAQGLGRKALCERVVVFQNNNGLAPDGIVGPATARKMITTSNNPCGVYGNSKDDCFLGVQSNGVLGNLYTVENGKVVANMPARFGNDKRPGGKKTPEGSFSIFRSIEGDHVGSNCKNDTACMRNPVYFYNGMAIHGTPNPQSTEGSLGCIGVSNQNSNEVYRYYKDGIEQVVVVDFQRGSN